MWLSDEQALALVERYGTPLFVYSNAELHARARELKDLKMPYGLVVRYAVKANPHPEILKEFLGLGLHFDASSSYEASMLLSLGIPGEKISLSSQQSPHNLPELLNAGVRFVATSMHQLEVFLKTANHGDTVALRVNPSIAYAGHNNRLSTGGEASSFGLWYEYIEEALQLARASDVVVNRLHMHIGSGADPAIWARAMDTALSIVRQMTDVTALDIGGGYKVARAKSEHETDMQLIGQLFASKLQDFAKETGRQLCLEVEPGTWLVAHAGVLLAEVDDIVDTGSQGYTFLRLNTGMNDIIRPAMYGAQHTIQVVNDSADEADYIVVGHNCETGDILTPAAGDPEHIAPRKMRKAAIGDTVVIADAGAYCASFSAKLYNAFPAATEVFAE